MKVKSDSILTKKKWFLSWSNEIFSTNDVSSECHCETSPQ